MAQKSKVVDITQSYIPVDPQAFPETLGLTRQEDDPLKDMSILAYEGYNFLPTSYGYRSYFSTHTLLSFDALPKPCDKMLAFQSKLYENALIAFCSDGIYFTRAGTTAWTKIWALTDTWTLSGVYSQYTWCVIENTLYIYRQGTANVLKINDDLTHAVFVPTFLNMAGQLGVFKANGSLAFWDSENSIAWSNVFDLTDFTPSVENQVGNVTFFGVQGRIVHVQDHGEGFVIYATKSIVGVTYSNTSTTIWDAGVITSESGVAHPGAITVGSTNQEHYVYTSTAIMKIGHYNALSRMFEAVPILPELFDYLRESRSPVYLACHAARFLHFSLVDGDYIGGRTSFTDTPLPSLTMPVLAVTDSTFTDFDNAGYPLTSREQFNILDSWLRKPGEALRTDYTAAKYDLPKWVAVATLGLVEGTAVDISGFNNTVSSGGGTYKTRVFPRSADIGTASTLATMLSALAIYDTVYTAPAPGVPTYNTAMGLKVIADNFILHPLNPSMVSKQAAYSGLHPDNAWEVIYNFFETIDEENKLAASIIASALASVASLNNYVLNWTLVTQTVPVANFTTPSDIVLLDKSIQVQATLILRQGLGSPPHLKIVSTTGKGKLITFAGSSRSIGSSTPVLDNPNAGGATNYILTVGDNYRLRSIGSLELATVYNLIESKQPFNIAPYGLGYATLNVLLQDPVIECKSSDPGFVVVLVKLDGSPHSRQPIQGFLKGPFDLYTTGKTCKYTRAFEYQTGNETFYSQYLLGTTNGIHFDPSPLLAALLPWQWEEIVHWPTGQGMVDILNAAIVNSGAGVYSKLVSNLTLPSGGFPPSTITDIHDYYYDATLNAIGATFTWTYVSYRNGLGVYVTATGTFTKILFLVKDSTDDPRILNELPPPGSSTYLYHTPVTDTIKCNAVDILLDHAQMTNAAHSLMLSMYASDEYTKQLDSSYLLTGTTTKFTPLITDFDLTEAIPDDYTESFYYDTSHTMVANSRACVPWTLTKGSIDLVGTDFMNHTEGTMLGIPMPLGPVSGLDELAPCYDDPGNIALAVRYPSAFVFPGSAYTLQDGVPIPGYPTKKGALVFDLQLKKWGKFKADHRALVEYAPINSVQNAVIPYTNFGMDSGILSTDGFVRVFSSTLVDSFMRYGKIGYFRFGVSRLMEIRLHFRTKSTGTIVLDGSLEGRIVDSYLEQTDTFTNVIEHIVYCDIKAKWFTISIHGQFDLQYLEFRGNMGSRR